MSLGVPVHMLAADASSSQPWWLVVAGIAGTIIVAFVAARGPVWLEKVKERRAARPAPTPSEKVTAAEDVLREWLEATRRDLKAALKENERLEAKNDKLEREMWRRGWDGPTG